MKTVNFRDDNDPKTIIIVNEHGDPARINFDDFKSGTHKVHPSSHRNHDGTDAGDDDATDVPPAKNAQGGGKADKGGKSKTDKVDDGQAYTLKDDATGKFFRTDKDGNKLIDTPFDTAELAAAATIPA